MNRTVFFSWQVDRPSREGRNLIEKALEKAISGIAHGATVEQAERQRLVVDKDTKGVPGSPPIFTTILGKIEKAAVFVPDLTFVATRPDGRPTPNPNILIEYGWALKALGYRRIIPVMNVAYGVPSAESMPFDLASLRFPITYNVPTDSADALRRAEREQLSTKLELALKEVLESDDIKGNIESQLASFIRKGNDLRSEWQKCLGSAEQVQRQPALAISGLHKAVGEYLNSIPRGSIYFARFQNQLRSSGSYPEGINVRIAGNWDLLHSDLARLNEFLLDPDLGKP
jgi:hypothetical protein